MGDLVHITFGNEPLIDKAELADRLGYSKRTVEKLVAEGMPSTIFGVCRVFRESAARNWLAHQDRKGTAHAEAR